jgi:citrate synthase
MTEIKINIATFDAKTITVRGKNLVDDLIGRHSFTDMLFFLTRNKFPTSAEARVLDACLVTLMEHGLNATTLITRLAYDSVPDQVQVAMAAGLAGVGDVFVGTMEGCARILYRGLQEGGDPDVYCRRVVAEFQSAKKNVPGFGHTTHSPDDPRAPRLFEVVAEAGLKGVYVDLVKRLGAALDHASGRHLTINATGAIAASLLEIGIPVDIMRCFAVVSRAGGLIGHIMEERKTHSARHIVNLARKHIPYEDPSVE